jgi:hypothetical protein
MSGSIMLAGLTGHVGLPPMCARLGTARQLDFDLAGPTITLTLTLPLAPAPDPELGPEPGRGPDAHPSISHSITSPRANPRCHVAGTRR